MLTSAAVLALNSNNGYRRFWPLRFLSCAAGEPRQPAWSDWRSETGHKKFDFIELPGAVHNHLYGFAVVSIRSLYYF